MSQFKFGPARPGEQVVFGAQRPGYNAKSVELSVVGDWIACIQRKGIRRVCCLLPDNQLRYYQGDLLRAYREDFGAKNVCSAEVEDYYLCERSKLESIILPFLAESDRLTAPVVVHCSGGSGRTGHVLAAWLARNRGLSVDSALRAVIATGRDPYEAVKCGNATEAQLRKLIGG